MMKVTAFKIAFLTYVAVCAVISILCTVFLFLDNNDSRDKTYSAVLFFIIGKWAGFLVARESKSQRAAAAKERQATFDRRIRSNDDIAADADV